MSLRICFLKILPDAMRGRFSSPNFDMCGNFERRKAIAEKILHLFIIEIAVRPYMDSRANDLAETFVRNRKHGRFE